jgi:hypothetical protein
VNRAIADGVPVFAIAVCYSGPLSDGEKALETLRTFARLVADTIGAISYVQMQSVFDPFSHPDCDPRQIKLVCTLSDKAIETCAEYVGKSPSPYTFGPNLEHWHGAATRVGVSDTAFPHRGSPSEPEKNGPRQVGLPSEDWRDPSEP